MRRLNRAPALLALIMGAAFVLAACSNMVEELKTVTPIVIGGLPQLSIKGEPQFHEGVVTVVVNGVIPETPKPKMVYQLPDGTRKEVEGTVTDNGDGTTTLVFDMRPAPDEIPEGPLNATLTAQGYSPTPIKVDYVPAKPLHVTGSDMQNPDGIVTVTITDDIPLTPNPTATYELPDGTKKEVEGTVTDNGDGTKTLTFDLNPIPSDLPGGTLPLTVNAPGYFKPAPVTVDYIPQAQIEMSVNGKDSNFALYNSEADGLEPPLIATNYHDNIDIKTTYTANPGGTLLADWNAVKEWLADPNNGGKTLTIKVDATPEPDIDPSAAATKQITITCKKDEAITKVLVSPNEPAVGETVEAVPYINSDVYTGTTMTWQWYVADASTGDGEAIEGATQRTYIVADGLQSKFLYAVGTQTLDGAVIAQKQSNNRLEVKPAATVSGYNTAYDDFSLAVTDLGQNTYKFVVTTSLANPTIAWYVDGIKKASSTSKEFTVNFESSEYSGCQIGWHNAQAVCMQNGTPYSARASVKKKIKQNAPTVASGGVTNESAWKAGDGKIQIAQPYDRAQYSTDGGSAWIDVAANGLITGLGVGDDWTKTLSVLLRYKADDDHASSATATVTLGITKYTVTHAATNGSITINTADNIPAGVSVSLTATANTYYTLDTSSIKAVKTSGGDAVALSGSGATRTFTMPMAAVTLSATFNKATYELTFSGDSNGSLTAEVGTTSISSGYQVAWGSEVKITITPKTNYKLKSITATGVTLSGDGNSRTFTMPKNAVAVSATFEEDLVFDTRATGVVVVYNKNKTGDAAYNYVTAERWNANITKYQNAGWNAVGVAFYNYVEGVRHPSSSERPGPEDIGDKKWYMLALDQDSNKNWTEASSLANAYSKGELTGWKLPEMRYQVEGIRSDKKMDQVIICNIDTLNSTLQSIGGTQISSTIYWSSENDATHSGQIDIQYNVAYDMCQGSDISYLFAVMMVHTLP